MKIRLALALAAVVTLPGCLQETKPWYQINGRYDSGNWFGARFALDLPPEWMRTYRVEDGLVATRDGFNIQTVTVAKMKIGDDLAYTKKKITKGMSPQELAEVLLDNLRSDGDVLSLKVLETRPATLSGQKGFRTTVSFKDGHGLRWKGVLCGVMAENRAWQMSYLAPARYYFDRDLPAFDAAMASLKIW